MRLKLFDMDNWREIGATLARNKTRTFLTAFGIFWGTAMLAMLWGGAGGLAQIVKRQVSGMSTNMAGVFPETTTMSYRGFNKGMSWYFSDQDIEDIRRITPHMEYSTPVDFRAGRVAYGSKSVSPNQILGVEADYGRLQIPKLRAGRFITESDFFKRNKVIVLGSNLCSNLFDSPDEAIGKEVSVGGVYFKIIGVAEQLSSASLMGRLEDNVVMPINVMNAVFPDQPTRHFVFIFSALPGHKPAELMPYIRRAVSKNHPIHPNDEGAMWNFDVSQMFEQASYIFIGINMLALFVGGGTLIAGIIGVANIMWIIVKERTQEIGIRRAIGAKPRDIILQVLCEGLILTFIAGVAGIAFAALVLGIADHAFADPVLGPAGFQLNFVQGIGIMLIFIVLGTIAGLIPSIKAMRIKPIEAINSK